MSPSPGRSADDAGGSDPTLLLAAASRAAQGHDVLPVIPEFELLGELGRGGMGIVYKARRKGQGDVVAVKIIRKDRLQHDESVRRFRREAQAAARLNHPNIVRVFDSDHTGNIHFLVMEYVAGVTLERLVEQKGPIDAPLAVDFLRQTAHALAHAHEQGLVHRDIKPSNIMVVPGAGTKPDGTPGLIKVLDMGVARVLRNEHHPADTLSTLTQGGSVIGTADFVAPEQLEDPHGADIRADLYSLGCTFYFVLTGQVPFPGGSLVSKLDKQRWQVPAAVNTLRPGVPAAVADVVSRLLLKKAAERYASPTELIVALDELVRSNYTTSEPPVAKPRVSRTLTGHAGPVLCVDTSRDGTRAASAGKDQTIRLWDLEAGKALRVIPRQTQEVRALAFSHAGDKLAAAIGVSVRVFDVATGLEVQRLGGHSAAVRCLAFAADDRWLYSGGDDKTLRVWDLAAGREGQRFTRHGGAVTSLVALDGDRVLTASRDQSMRLWDLRSGQESRHWIVTGGPILDIAVAGELVASAHFDTILRLWKLDIDQPVGELAGHKQMVSGVGFLPDGSLVSISQDQTLRWWDLAEGREQACVEMSVNALAMVPGARRAVLAGADVAVLEFPE